MPSQGPPPVLGCGPARAGCGSRGSSSVPLGAEAPSLRQRTGRVPRRATAGCVCARADPGRAGAPGRAPARGCRSARTAHSGRVASAQRSGCHRNVAHHNFAARVTRRPILAASADRARRRYTHPLLQVQSRRASDSTSRGRARSGERRRPSRRRADRGLCAPSRSPVGHHQSELGVVDEARVVLVGLADQTLRARAVETSGGGGLDPRHAHVARANGRGARTSMSIVRPKSLMMLRSFSVEISPVLSAFPPSAMNASTAPRTRAWAKGRAGPPPGRGGGRTHPCRSRRPGWPACSSAS